MGERKRGGESECVCVSEREREREREREMLTGACWIMLHGGHIMWGIAGSRHLAPLGPICSWVWSLHHRRPEILTVPI